MDNTLINYIGIDFDKDIDFDWIIPYKLHDTLNLDDSIYDLLSFSVHKKCFDYKVLDFFNDYNYLNKSFYNNLIIFKNLFELNFEYASKDTPSKISIFNYNLYDAITDSLENFQNERLDVKIYTSDLFCNIINDNTLFYCINSTLCLNAL